MAKRISTKTMILVAGPFDRTPQEKAILGKMIALYLQAGTPFHIEQRISGLYLWRSKKGYKAGSDGRDAQREGKKTTMQGPYVAKGRHVTRKTRKA